MKFWSQRTFKSGIHDKKCLIELSEFCIAEQLSIWCESRRRKPTQFTVINRNARGRRASEVTNEVSISNIYFKTSGLAPISDQNLKKGRPIVLFKLVFEIRFSDALLATVVNFLSPEGIKIPKVLRSTFICLMRRLLTYGFCLLICFLRSTYFLYHCLEMLLEPTQYLRFREAVFICQAVGSYQLIICYY